MFVYLIPRIVENKIRTPEGLFKYMQIASKHSYLNLIRSRRRENFVYLAEEPAEAPDQIWNLIDEETEKQLCKCISKLSGRLKIQDRKSTRLNSSHVAISYAVFCLKKKTGLPLWLIANNNR